jgi:hypothetical protein
LLGYAPWATVTAAAANDPSMWSLCSGVTPQQCEVSPLVVARRDGEVETGEFSDMTRFPKGDTCELIDLGGLPNGLPVEKQIAQLNTFDLLLRRMSAGRTEQSMIVTGLRGVGKTVLLGRFRGTAQELGWVEREVSKHDDEQFRRQMVGAIRTSLFEMSPKARWGDRMQRAAAVLKSFSVSVDPTGTLTGGIDVDAAQGFADQQELQADLTDVLVAVGKL